MKDSNVHCLTSISILKERCNHFFTKRNYNANPFYIDIDLADHSTDVTFDSRQTVDIVFFGGIIRKSCILKDLNFSTARLWVLSNSYKKILSDFFSIPPSSIGIIDRLALFEPLPMPQIPLPKFIAGKTYNFVYPGRLSRPKNIILLLKAVYCLQKDYDLNINLTLLGDFDEELNHSSRSIARLPLKDEVQALLDHLDWHTKPNIMPPLPSHSWHQSLPSDTVLINLSTYLQEDFGVSCAQWQQQNRPMIISNWGGHCDIFGKNILKINPLIIGDHDYPEELTHFFSKKIAEEIFNSSCASMPIASISMPAKVAPQPIDGNNLVALIENRLSRLPFRHLIEVGQWQDIAERSDSTEYFCFLRSYFRPDYSPSSPIVILPRYRFSKRSELQFLVSHLDHIFSQSYPEYLFLNELTVSLNLKRIFLSQDILIPFAIPELISLIPKLLPSLSSQGTITIYSSDQSLSSLASIPQVRIQQFCP